MWKMESKSCEKTRYGAQFLWNPLGTSIGHPKIRLVFVYLGLKK